MKFRIIHTEVVEKDPEPVVNIKVFRSEEGHIEIMAKLAGSEDAYSYIVTLTSEGYLQKTEGINENLGFNLDDSGQIETERC